MNIGLIAPTAELAQKRLTVDPLNMESRNLPMDRLDLIRDPHDRRMKAVSLRTWRETGVLRQPLQPIEVTADRGGRLAGANEIRKRFGHSRAIDGLCRKVSPKAVDHRAQAASEQFGKIEGVGPGKRTGPL